MNTTVPRKNFRAIVVGAGVTGLTLSHALTKAKIEHVVLERGDVGPLQGSSIGIHPHGCRILDQLGCLEAIERLCSPMKNFVNRLPNGQVLTRSKFFDSITSRNGYDFLNVERRAYLQTMFACLPDQDVIRRHQQVTSIVDNEEEISVTLADGTVERGDIIVGCDGVNSIVRQAMWANTNGTMPLHQVPAEKKTLQTTYRCLLGIAHSFAGLGTRDMTCVHEHEFSFLFLSQPNQTYFFVFEKLLNPSKWPNPHRWTNMDAERLAEKVKDHPVSDSLLFGEVWDSRTRAQLVSIEEGVFKHWYSGRMVLAGDSAHKITPNFALGGNTGIESITVLTNELHQLLKATPHVRPARHALVAMFQRYQYQRMSRVRKIRVLSSFITRLQALDGILMRYMALWFIPYLVGDERIADQLGHIVRHAPKLNFICIKSRKGTMSWADETRTSDTTDAPSQSLNDWRLWVSMLAFIPMLAYLNGVRLSGLFQALELKLDY